MMLKAGASLRSQIINDPFMIGHSRRAKIFRNARFETQAFAMGKIGYNHWRKAYLEADIHLMLGFRAQVLYYLKLHTVGDQTAKCLDCCGWTYTNGFVTIVRGRMYMPFLSPTAKKGSPWETLIWLLGCNQFTSPYRFLFGILLCRFSTGSHTFHLCNFANGLEVQSNNMWRKL